MKKIAVILSIGIVILGFGGRHLMRQLIYFPDRTVSKQESAQIEALGFKPFEDKGYLRDHPKPDKIIAIFHGNAGNAAQRTYLVAGLLDERVAIFLAEYPGYGRRPGKSTEQNIYNAAKDDIEKIKAQYPDIPLVLIGESLGSGVAAWLAGQVNPHAIILISPFTSLADVGSTHYPFLPVRLLLPDRYESIVHLKNQKIPLLVIHGDRDNIVPFSYGQKLHDSYTGPKAFLPQKGYSHNDLPWGNMTGELWQKVREWLRIS